MSGFARYCMTAAVAALLSSPLHAIQDSNNNGLSDVWERFYNNDNLFPSSSPYFAEDDPDADGWTNSDEAVAGSNPFSAALPEGWVRTTMQAHPEADGCFLLSWPSMMGKAYRLSVSTNLVDWADFGEVMAGTGLEIALALDCEYEEGGTPERMFWRVRIEDADPDGDGLTTWEELALQTDPYHPDTDRDGIFDSLDADPLISATLADPDGLGLPASLDTGLIGRWDFESSYFASTSEVAGLPVRPRNGFWTPNGVAGAVPAKFSGLADAQGMISKGGDNRQSQFVLIDGNILKNHHGAFSTSFWAKLNPAEISESGSSYYKALWSLTERDNATNIEGNALLVRKVGNEEEWYLGGYEWTSTGGQADSAFLGQTVRFPAGTHDDGEWHHFVITRGGGRWKLVIDGEQCLDFSGGWVPLDFHPLTTNPLNPSTLLLLGRFHEGSSTNQLNASIDRLKVWSRTLNPTNPDEIGHLWKQDADNDGLWDVTEVRTSLWRDLNSNALRDSNEFAYISSPFEWQFATTDSDGDEASDLDEQTAGTLIGKSDSDGDLLPDGWELLHGLNPLVSNATDSNSNGVFEDNEYTNSDNDSLTDIQEYRHNTDPKLANSDGGDPLNPDNVNDSTEVAQGSNPNDPTDGGQEPSPNEMLSLTLGIGDQSGSKSEDYVMHCYRLDPETGIETRVYTLRSGGYGKYEEKTVGNVFRRGETYTYQIKWQGSKLTSQSASGGQSAEGPDFDYTFKVELQGNDPGAVILDTWDPDIRTLSTSTDLLGNEMSDVAQNLQTFREELESKRVLLMPLKIGLVQMTDAGTLIEQPDPGIEMNMAGPEFAITPGAVGGLEVDSDGISAEIALSGTVYSKSCDAVAGTLGTITEVTVEANGIGGYQDDDLTLATQVSKGQDGAGPFAYPFSGAFTLPSTRMNLTEGINTVSVEALDPVSGQVGRSTLAFNVTAVGGDSPFPTLGINGLQLTVTGVDEAAQGTATLAYVTGGQSYSHLLTETSAASLDYEAAGEDFTVRVAEENGTLYAYLNRESWELAEFRVALVPSGQDYQGQVLPAPFTLDPGAAPPPFSHLVVSSPEVVAESGPGEARVYAVRLEGFEMFDDAVIDQITTNWAEHTNTTFELIRDPGDEAVLFEDPNRPGQPLSVLPRPQEVAGGDPAGSEHTQRLADWVGDRSETEQFVAGLVYGISQGGVDLVVGTGQTWWNGVNYLGEELGQGFNHVELTWVEVFGSAEEKERVRLQIELAQQDLAERRQAIQDFIEAVELLDAWIDEANTDLLVTIFVRPFNAAAADQANHRLDEKSQEILEIYSMLHEHIASTWQGAATYDKGRYTGIVVFEIASSFIAVSKLGKVTKAKWLTELAKREVNIPGWNGLKVKAGQLATEFTTTKMCFVAGTLVLTADGLVPIQAITPGMHVWSRNETTGGMAWKPVVECFATHPSVLVHVQLDTDGDGDVDEAISGTAEHPFWEAVSGQWIEMGKLAPGHRLMDKQGATPIYVLATQRQNAPPEQGCFTTYNFEVADYHTYFVGTAGIWVHNSSVAACEKIFGVFYQKAKLLGGVANLRAQRFNILKDSRAVLLADREIPDESWRASAVEVSKRMMKDFANGKIASTGDLPSVTRWNDEFFGRSGNVGSIPKGRGLGDAVEVHHTVEKWIQTKLGIPETDDVPGAAMFKKTGQPDGHAALQGRLRAEVTGLTDSDEIVSAMRSVYQSRPEWEDLWPAAENWLQGMGVSIPN
jgi:hypothetical protein